MGLRNGKFYEGQRCGREALIKDEAVHQGGLCRCLGGTLHKREKSDADPCKYS